MLDTKGDVKASKRAIKKEDKDETEVIELFAWMKNIFRRKISEIK